MSITFGDDFTKQIMDDFDKKKKQKSVNIVLVWDRFEKLVSTQPYSKCVW